MMFKVSDDLAELTGLGKNATPEAFEKRILDLCAQVESDQKMSKEFLDKLTALEQRIVSLEAKPTQSIDLDAIKKDFEATARMTASQIVSESIAKAGVTGVTTSTAETAETVVTPSRTAAVVAAEINAETDPVKRGTLYKELKALWS